MPKTYKCMCSRCYNGSKSVTKRTIEVHLQQDRDSLQCQVPVGTLTARRVQVPNAFCKFKGFSASVVLGS